MRRRFFYQTISSDQIGIPYNEIWYTSFDNNVVNPEDSFNAPIISNTYSNGKGVLIFANSVTSIGDWAFQNCSSLTSISIPESVTKIEYWAFYYCSGLTSVTIPNSVTSIGVGAFSGCSGLTSVTIGNSVTSIGGDAFYDCSSLTSITIPPSVREINGWAFADCYGLTSITCEAIIPPMIDDYTFDLVSTSIPIYVPAESVDAYKSAQYWSNFTNIQAIS